VVSKFVNPNDVIREIEKGENLKTYAASIYRMNDEGNL